MSRVLYTVCTLSFVLVASACQQEEVLQPTARSQPVQQARLEAEESATTAFEYFFYVDGVRYNRGDYLYVTAGQQFFVELRCQEVRYSNSRPFPITVNSWSYDQRYIKFVRKYSPEMNNAIKYDVIAPWFAPGNFETRPLGNITAAFSAFSNTSAAERQPVYIQVVQVGGGIQEPNW